MDIFTPVGRIVQGSVVMQQQRDMDTNQPLLDAQGNPVMGVFIALAFPKVLPNGQPNTEFDNFYAQLKQVAAAAWPQLFPQGAAGPCVNPRFSWKYQDGDGFNSSGTSVAAKPGFAGNHIIRFFTSYPVRCHHEGKWAAHEEIQKPEEIVKRGYWVQLLVEVKSNNATGTQVPGISLYPKVVVFIERGEEISTGINVEAAMGARTTGWRPPASASPIPTGALPPAPAVAVPAVAAPAVAVPVAVPAVAVPVAPVGPTVSAALAAQGVTWPMLAAQGWTEEAARAGGHII